VDDAAYPELLKASKIQGTVEIQVVVDTLGRAEVSTLKVMNDARPEFVESVKSALGRIKYFPAEIDGRKVRQLVQQSFNFTIGDSAVVRFGGPSGPDLLTADDLANTGSSDLRQALEKLRPSWVNGESSSRGSVVPPAYFVNGVKASGGAADMRKYLVSNTLEIRFIRAADARSKYGDEGVYGVVEVRTRRLKL
jgi:hypothetical protein